MHSSFKPHPDTDIICEVFGSDHVIPASEYIKIALELGYSDVQSKMSYNRCISLGSMINTNGFLYSMY